MTTTKLVQERELLVLGPTSRKIDAYRIIQFLLLAWVVSAALYPEVPLLEVTGHNSAIAVNVAFLLSGLLTHLRYADFFRGTIKRKLLSDPKSVEMIKLYIVLRVLLFAPFVLIAIVASLLLAISHGCTFRQYLATITFTSSIFTMYPLKSAQDAASLVLHSCPALVPGGSLLLCWLAYPWMSRAIMTVTGSVSSRSRRAFVAAILYFISCWFAPRFWSFFISLNLPAFPVPSDEVMSSLRAPYMYFSAGITRPKHIFRRSTLVLSSIVQTSGFCWGCMCSRIYSHH